MVVPLQLVRMFTEDNNPLGLEKCAPLLEAVEGIGEDLERFQPQAGV